MNNTQAARNYLTNSSKAAETVAAMGGPAAGYHRKIWAANDLVLQAFELDGEPGVRELLASLRRIEADDVVIAETERLHRAVQVRS